MSWEQTWRLKARRLRVQELQQKAQTVAQDYQGVEVEVEAEADDCISFFFWVPDADAEADTPDEGDDPAVCLEVSLYAMGDGTHILSLEGDAGDNGAHWDAASQLAEDLAEALGAHPLDL